MSGFSPDFRALNDEVMKNTYVTLKNLELERMGLLAKYSLQSVEVITLDKKIEALKQFTTESIEKKLLNISDKREKIYTSLDDLEEVFKDFPDKERKLLKLQREFQLHEQTYKLLVKKKIRVGRRTIVHGFLS